MSDQFGSSSRSWLIAVTIIVLLGAGGLAWWGFGHLPMRAVLLVPAGHWLFPYLRSDGSIDTMTAFRNQAGAIGPPYENLAALLVEMLGPTALSPDPSAELIAALGKASTLPNGPLLELPPTGKPLTHEEIQQIIEQATKDIVAGSEPVQSPPSFWNDLGTAAKKPWTSDELPPIASWLDRQQPVLDLVAAWRPTRCSIPRTHDQAASKPVTLRMWPVLILGRACAAEAFRALARNDVKSTVRYAAALQRMGALASRADDLQDVILGATLMDLADDVMMAVLPLPVVTDADLAPWNEATASSAWAPDLARVIDQGQRLKIIEVIQDGLRKNPGPAEPTLVIRRINDYYDQLVAIARIKSWTEQRQALIGLADTNPPVLLERLGADYRGTWGMFKLVCGGPFLRREIGTATTVLIAASIGFPNIDAISGMLRRAGTRLSLVNAAILLRGDLATIAMPVDLFGEGPVHHSRVGSSLRIWSVGRDGVDNGGIRGGVHGGDDIVLIMPITEKNGR
jgi:hypothetical protein